MFKGVRVIERYELPESYYRLSDFRRRFLKPAIADIEICTDIYDLEFIETKSAGRSYIEFKWKVRGETKSSNKKLAPIEQAKVIHSKIVAGENVSKEELLILKKHITELVISGFDICDLAKALLQEL